MRRYISFSIVSNGKIEGTKQPLKDFTKLQDAIVETFSVFPIYLKLVPLFKILLVIYIILF